MIPRVFLDANVILDFTLKRETYEDCFQLIKKTELGEILSYISPSIIQMSGYWLAKAYGWEQAKKILVALTNIITVVDCDHEIVVNGLKSSFKDVEDAIQYFTALNHKMDFFISLDKEFKKYAYENLEVQSPEEFLELLTK